MADAETRRFKEDSTHVKDWLKRLEGAAYEMDDVLDEWNYYAIAIQIEQSGTPNYKVPSFVMCLCFDKLATRHHTAKKIDNVKAKLGAIDMAS